ncbi:MAG: pyridoxal phosphate-dependent aminotransferase [Spirochaetales bacterium]
MNELMATAAAFRAQGRSIVDLTDTNFHNHGLRYPDSRLKRHFIDYVDDRGYRSESRGMQRTRDRLSRWYAFEGDSVDPDRVILTASTSESYSLVFQSLLAAGDRILLPAPTYPLFEQLCEYARLEPLYYRLQPKRNFAPEFPDVAAGLEAGAKALVIISPNNPTGSVLSTAQLARFDRLAAAYGAFVVSDEVFRGTEREGMAACAPDRLEKREAEWYRFAGLSKLFASPDLKLAWIIASGVGERRFEALELAADTFLNASTPSQYVASRMLEDGRDIALNIREALSARAAVAGAVLENITGVYGGLHLKAFPQPGGIHRVLQIPGTDDERIALDLLEQESVLVHPGYFYGFPDDGYLVISTVSKQSVLTEGLDRLAGFMRSLGKAE